MSSHAPGARLLFAGHAWPSDVRRPAIIAAGCTIALVAALVLGSWAWGPWLAALIDGWRVMVPSSALGFICIGLGLAIFAADAGGAAKHLPQVLAGAAAIVPLITMVEYFTGLRSGVESVLGIEFSSDSPTAGRMSPVTALSFILIAISVAGLPRTSLLGQSAVRLAAGTALAISWLAVLAVSFDGSRLLNLPIFPGMAVLTILLAATSSATVLASSAHAMAKLRGAHLDVSLRPVSLLLAFAFPLLLGQLRTVIAPHLEPQVATAVVVTLFAMALAAVVWRILTRLDAFQTQRERLMVDLESRMDARTHELEVANRQLHASEERLLEADRRKDEFLATLAHELRNPLAPIRTGLEILKADSVEPAHAAQAHQVIGRQMRHMVRLVDDLLDVSRITADKLALRFEVVEVNEVLHQSVETVRPELERMRHTLTLSPPPAETVVRGDPTRLTQIVANLLQNACKYTPRGGHITLGAVQVDDIVEIRVRDDGIGIAAQDLPRLFEKFSQVSPRAPSGGGGLGLGLALVRGLVTLHGGKVEAHSAGAGEGSEFVVRLPSVTAPAAAEPAWHQATAVTEPPRRVLVVDDNVDNADALALYLRRRGHTVDLAYDGETACDTAERMRPEVVLLDIGLPKMSGHDVCRFIRAQPWGANVQVIAQTGWGQEPDRQRSRLAGFDHHLVKPVDPDALAELLAHQP